MNRSSAFGFGSGRVTDLVHGRPTPTYQGEVGSVPRRVVALSYLFTTPSADARSTITLCKVRPPDCRLDAADRLDLGPRSRFGTHTNGEIETARFRGGESLGRVSAYSLCGGKPSGRNGN